MTDTFDSLHFSTSLFLALVHSGTTTCYENKEIEWRLFNVNHSGCTYPSLFHVVGRSLLRTSQNKTEVRCVIQECHRMFSHSYSPVLLPKYPILTFFSKSFSLIGKCAGWFCLNVSTYFPQYLCLRVCHWVVPHWSVTTQFTYDVVIHRAYLSTSTVGGYAFRLPSISHADGIHEFLFV